MAMAWMDSEYWNSSSEYLDSSIWCVCNPKLPSLCRLILHFSYIYTDCDICFSSRYKYKYRKHIYEYADEDKHKLELENEDDDEILIQIKNLIKNNPKIVYMKMMDITPIELIHKLDTILDVEDTHPFLKHREHCKIRYNQHNLFEILKFAKIVYLNYELGKNVAFRYIKNSNHIGNRGELLQLPLHIWEYIFTFI
jgi:hypothetical protein